MIEEGAEMVRPLLMQEPYEVLGGLLDLVSRICSNAYVGVLQRLLHLPSGMAVIVHGVQHPIPNACRLLEALYTKQHVLELASRKIRDVLKHCLGEDHTASLDAQRLVSRDLIKQRRYREAERSLRDLVEISERFCGRNAYNTRYALVDLAYLYYTMFRDSEAEDIIQDVLQRCRECGKADNPYAIVKDYQALICLQREDYIAAEKHSWSALSSSLLQFGPEGPYTTRTWLDYQYVAREQQGSHRALMPLPQNPHAICDVSDEPVRRFSRPRSSSLPQLGNGDWVAGFWSKTLLGPKSMAYQPPDLKRRLSLPTLGILKTLQSQPISQPPTHRQ